MTLSKRDAHLQEFLPSEVIKELDDAEKNVLYEEFANSELRIMASQPIEFIKARLKNYLTAEFQRRLSQINEEEYEVLKPWYIENCHTVDEIHCMKCGVLLGLEVDTIDDQMNPSHHEGKFIVAIGDKLMAYRPRLDGVMGFQCGNVIENEAVAEEWATFEKEVKAAATEFDEANETYQKELVKFNKLSEKTKAKRQPPAEPAPRVITPPKEPKLIECGNYNLWAQIELDNIPEAHVMTSVTKEDRIKVKQEMNAADYAPDVKETKQGRTVESFELRKVK